MAKGHGGGRDWQQRGRVEDLRAAAQARAQQRQTLLANRSMAAPPTGLSRPGLKSSTVQHFATTAAPTSWSVAGRARSITDAVLDAVEDGTDRVILGWPHPPLGGLAAAAIVLREARATGRLAHATVGYWPWRNGATWSARTLLVGPADVHQAATKYATELRRPQAWALPDLGHEAQYMLELRLSDLVAPPSDAPDVRSRNAILVRSPTLLETTSVFPPNQGGTPFRADPEQVLRRVRDHTHMGDRNADLKDHVSAVGDPMMAPFALFGLPPEVRPERLKRFLQYPRFERLGLDVIVADVSRTGRSELPEDWDKRFAALLEGIAATPGRRPPLVVLADDVFTMRRAARALKAHGQTLRPHRARPIETGAYLPQPGPLGACVDLQDHLPPVRFEADIKDASLATLRQGLVRLGRELRQAGHTTPAEGVSKALALIRRAASLPIGLAEARDIADILFDAEDEVDTAARSLFRPKMALGGLASVKVTAPAFGEVANRLVATIESKLAHWGDETPVSAKLASLLSTSEWNSARTLIALPDRRLADIYLGSDRAVRTLADVVDHRSLPDEFSREVHDRLVLVGPTPDAVRLVLTAPGCPGRVLMLGDAAGSALVVAEVAPIARIAAFAPVARRAKELGQALERAGADEPLDLAEAEFRVEAIIPEGEIDLTQAGEGYHGEVICLRTARGDNLAYRPLSDVLRYSPSEVRPFERVQARAVTEGDRILVLNAAVREPIRRAIAGSREALEQLSIYHKVVDQALAETPGATDNDRARHILARMRDADPGFAETELPNVLRWLRAGRALASVDGLRQPGAPRDWPRFRAFMSAVAIDEAEASIYWRVAIQPARSYRAQEGYLFNQRVVRFVLDPEGASIGAGAWAAMPGLWQLVLDSVDEVMHRDDTRRTRHG